MVQSAPTPTSIANGTAVPLPIVGTRPSYVYPEIAYLSRSTKLNSPNTEVGDTLIFPVNPNSVNWSYQLNKQSFDTYGGRVTQILSVNIQEMTIQGDAGSRANLMNFFQGLKNLQQYQIAKGLPLYFYLPTANLSFSLYIQQMDIGFDPTTTTYPYNLAFQIEEVLSEGNSNYGSLSALITSAAIAGLFSNSATANEMGFGNGSTTLGQYFAGTAGLSRYGMTATNLSQKQIQNNLIQPADLGGTTY